MDDLDVAIVALALYTVKQKRRNQKRPGSRKGRLWSREWLTRRPQYSHENLLADLRLTAPKDYRDYLRLDCDTFDKLLNLVTLYIQRKNTVMRDAITPSERLSTTLQFLASGRSFNNMKFSCAMAECTIGKVIMETCNAMIVTLKDYIRVSKHNIYIYQTFSV
jgi:hypothetical protein